VAPTAVGTSERGSAQKTHSAGSVNMVWTNDATLQLISEYQKHVVLWDSTHNFYKLVNKKNDAWEEIAKEVGISVPDVKKKIHNCRN
jgi:hypothetical protein